ncbi:MAG: PepSY-associated TM helix domain-containing protein [Acidobacteriaceae bacterium]|jgi:uncharacterized iron-regulated membrane protein
MISRRRWLKESLLRLRLPAWGREGHGGQKELGPKADAVTTGRLKPLRKYSLTLHLWLGLIAAVFLFVEGVTGGIMAWGSEIFRLLNPPGRQADVQIYHAPSGGTTRLSLDALAAALEATHPGFRLFAIEFSQQSDLAWVADLQGSRFGAMRVWFDPHTGEEVGTQAPASRGRWLEVLVNVASRLHSDVVAGVVLLLLALSGLILWWPRKILVSRRPTLSARTNFELHSSIGFYSSLVLIVFSVTSMIIIYSRPAIRVVARITHTPAVPSVQRLSASTALEGGAKRLDLDESMRAAMQLLPPGARFTDMSRMNNGQLYFFYQPSGGTYDLQGLLLVNPKTGKVQQLEAPRNYTFAERVVRVQVRQIHTGEFLGAPTRWIAGFFSFMLAVLSVTGPLIWWNRRYRMRG